MDAKNLAELVFGKGQKPGPLQFDGSLEINLKDELRVADSVKIPLVSGEISPYDLEDALGPFKNFAKTYGYSLIVVSEIPDEAKHTTAYDRLKRTYYLEFRKKIISEESNLNESKGFLSRIIKYLYGGNLT